MTQAPDWPSDIFKALKAASVRQVSYVPDAGHSRLIKMCHDDPEIAATVLTTEEEGIGLGCGAWLGGQRHALLMQSSGVGNCVNGFSLLKSCGLPFLTIITMRGQWGEFNPWQVPMGSATPAVLELFGFRVYPVDQPDQVGPTVAAGAKLAFDSTVPVAVLLGQRLIGTKAFKEG
jgi:sulfopyruvate decarboxylase alpha subunit